MERIQDRPHRQERVLRLVEAIRRQERIGQVLQVERTLLQKQIEQLHRVEHIR